MVDCKHRRLVLLEGPIHDSGKDYACADCGERFKAEVFKITSHFGTNPPITGGGFQESSETE
jgi:hypothetical protein